MPFRPSHPVIVATAIILTLGPLATSAAATSAAITANCQLAVTDTGVNGIAIDDPDSAKSQISGDHELFQNEDGASFLQFASADGAESLALIPGPGSTIDRFDEFEVRYRAEDEQLPTMQADRFTSALGIQLGQTMDQVVERMGSCYRRLPTDYGTEVLLYERVDAPAAPGDATADEPKFYSPTYYAEYEFDGDKLMRFRFGLNQAAVEGVAP